MARRAFYSTSKIVVAHGSKAADDLEKSRNKQRGQPQTRLVEKQQTRPAHERPRNMASICCSPPESVPADWLRRSDSLGNNSNIRSISLAISARS